MQNNNKSKQLTFAALMLAIAVSGQFFKNLSVCITGPIVNTALLLTVLYSGLGNALKSAQVEVARVTFSLTQPYTAAIGSAITTLILPVIKASRSS